MLKAKSFLALTGAFVVLFAGALGTFANEGEPVTGNLSTDAEVAMKQFQVPPGFKVEVWASEPQLKNPVAFCFDEKGRVYVVETFRLKTCVWDVRSHMNMFDDDLACRTVEDRAAMVHKFLGDKDVDFTKDSDVVQLLEDRAGKGRADHSTVFADGFNSIVDGLGAGVLARKGNVYFANIPNLWLLQDTNHDGKADARTSLSYGYGVHYNLLGHDLHGLRIGPDGRLYFSIGDRGLHVKTKEGKLLDYPDMGTVLRCNQDGSNLEIFAYGVRNPQELVFDDYGNLWTGDNNCDHGDSARLVYVVEGGDSGWRTGNQFSETTPAGVWNAEKLWHLQFPGQAAYILPPVGHIASGPSGLAHYPGTGFPASFKDHFFLCDFRGSSKNSGIHSFTVKPNGASFEMTGRTNFFWDILATDVDFSPDGQMYVADWVQSWDMTQKGRIYRLYHPEAVKDPVVLETKKLIAEGMEKRSNKDLAKLLEHPDQRVRQEAQFELESRAKPMLLGGLAKKSTLWGDAVPVLNGVASASTNQLARIHAIWAIGNISRIADPSVLTRVELMAKDSDPEIRAQIARTVGDSGGKADSDYDLLVGYLKDPSPRVQFFAALGLGKMAKINPAKNAATVRDLFALLRANADKDVYVRHAVVMGLVGLASKSDLVEAAKDSSNSVRMGALLAMRRLQLPEIATFLHDADPLIVLEAARAINDVPIKDAMPQLAALIDHPTQNEPLDWRVINANFRLGDAKNALALANYATQNGATEKVRGEALHALETWAKPLPRERLTGLWKPLAERDGKPATDALRPVIASILSTAPDGVKIAAMHAAQKLSVMESAQALYDIFTNTKSSGNVRVEALKALEELHASTLPEAVKIAVADADENVRKEGNRLKAETQPGDATGTLTAVLEKGTVTEKQGAFATLGTLPGEAVDKLLADWLDKLAAGKVQNEIQFELVEAANKRTSALIKEKLKHYLDAQPKDDEFADFRETLYGGNAELGKKVFMERPEAQCTRCHKVNGEGGEVGPELAGILTRHNREYILESILYPNKQVAPGFESLIVKTKSGSAYGGLLKSENDQELLLITPDDGPVKIKKSDITSREKGQSAMPEGMGTVLSKQDIRNLVEFLAATKQVVAANSKAPAK
ncbi:MAG: Heme-binding protein [Pedosphaera sp.]|nr:Heme-binding protein [Pedosphaera sp.]